MTTYKYIRKWGSASGGGGVCGVYNPFLTALFTGTRVRLDKLLGV